MHSAIYRGRVRHRRFSPTPHQFSYPLFLMYVDLQELPTLFQRFWLWSAGRWNFAWFNRKDHMAPADKPLHSVVRDKIAEVTGVVPSGPIRLLTHFRYVGFGFNPVSFYYCFSADDSVVETIVCEVNNTPWGEQHLYILPQQDNLGSVDKLQFQRTKEFHVSPFMPMDIAYNWYFTKPDHHLAVHMENYQHNCKLFDATLTLQRQEISSASLALILLRFPFITIQVVAGIYFEAVRLWLKKTPFYSHPNSEEAS